MSSSTSSGGAEPDQESACPGDESLGRNDDSSERKLNLGVHEEPGQGLNVGEATPPRQAATVIVLRGGARTLELLLVKRTEMAKFMGGVWVFPGGAVRSEEH